jgi:hypothetical protein
MSELLLDFIVNLKDDESIHFQPSPNQLALGIRFTKGGMSRTVYLDKKLISDAPFDIVTHTVKTLAHKVFMENQRGTGRTHRMIQEVCDALERGKDKISVWGATRRQALGDLKPRVVAELKTRGIPIARETQDRIDTGHSVILFRVAGMDDDRARGFHGFQDFYDHYVGEFQHKSAKARKWETWTDDILGTAISDSKPDPDWPGHSLVDVELKLPPTKEQ